MFFCWTQIHFRKKYKKFFGSLWGKDMMPFPSFFFWGGGCMAGLPPPPESAIGPAQDMLLSLVYRCNEVLCLHLCNKISPGIGGSCRYGAGASHYVALKVNRMFSQFHSHINQRVCKNNSNQTPPLLIMYSITLLAIKRYLCSLPEWSPQEFIGGMGTGRGSFR